MSKTVFARQVGAIGQVVCEDARVGPGERRGQQGREIGINYATTAELLHQITQRISGKHILARS